MDLYEGNKTFNWELVGEGNTYDEIIVDFIDFTKELMEIPTSCHFYIKGVWKIHLNKKYMVLTYWKNNDMEYTTLYGTKCIDGQENGSRKSLVWDAINSKTIVLVER
ncbi:hypothetical protein D922_04039 [Enterococcus faecalis 06-MB-DW-09]|nr:hypothetical protein D922_04039 [Enterococcus faecalis 06-MB-DW-09]